MRDEGPPLLKDLNRTLETTGELPAQAWTWWLWQTPPEEPLHPTVLLNRNQLLGLLVCRHHAARRARSDAAAAVLPCTDRRMQLMDTAPSAMTLGEVRDTVDNVRIEWARFLSRIESNPHAEANLRAVLELVDGCFERFGYFAANALPPEVLDDTANTEEETSTTVRLTNGCLRRLLGMFLILYRHFHLLAEHTSLASTTDFDSGVRKHHLEASHEEYHTLCMHLYLPVAARLDYKLLYTGMYNHVSQAVFLYDQNYRRSIRIKMEDVHKGDPSQLLPAVAQLYPEIKFHYEEDPLDLSRPIGKWVWLILPGRIYLVDPEARVFHSQNLIVLVEHYCKETRKV